MKASEYKELAQASGVFASPREGAMPPESLIGVQVGRGKAKFISGSGPAVMIASLPGEYAGRFSYTIEARPFLQAAKVVTGKQEVTIDIEPEGVTISTSDGGRVFLRAGGLLSEAGFAKKPKAFVVRSSINASAFSQLAKVFDVVHGDIEIEAPSLEQVDEASHLVAVQPGSRAMYVHFETLGEMLEPEIRGYNAAAYPSFWRSLKHFNAAGLIDWGEEGVLASSGQYELYATPYRVARYDPETRTSESPRAPDPWPILALAAKPTVSFTVEKKPLMEAIKGVMPRDEHGRVTLAVRSGALEVVAWGEESGIRMPVESLNEGHRAASSGYLLKLLRAMDGKSVTIGWSQQPPLVLASPEMEGFTILLAPVALSGNA